MDHRVVNLRDVLDQPQAFTVKDICPSMLVKYWTFLAVLTVFLIGFSS